MASKAGGNSRKIGRNKDKPWKKRYDFTMAHDRNKRLNGERKQRITAKCRKRWERRIKKGKPARGHARALRRLHMQRIAA
jgi:phage gp16-like protein